MTDSEEYIYLTALELDALAAAAGIERWFGPEIPVQDPISKKEDLNRVLAGLYQKGMIDWSTDTAVIVEWVRRMLGIFRRATVCITAFTREHLDETRYAYPADRWVTLLEVSNHDRDLYRVSCMSINRWLEILREEELFPNPVVEAPKELPSHTSQQEYHSQLCLYHMKEGLMLQRMRIYDEGLYATIHLEKTGREKGYTCFCNRESYETILRDWLKRGGL